MNNKLKIILIISLGLNLVTSLFVAKQLYTRYKNYKIANSTQTEFTYLYDRDELFETLPIDDNSIVFLGNSLINNFELAELFQNLKIKNRGISGDKIDGVINRLDPIIRLKPNKIFIEIGINDLGYRSNKDVVLTKYKKLINLLRSKLPKTKIYIQSLFPTETGRQEYKTYCTEAVNRDIIEINNELSKLPLKQNLTFINTHSSFVMNGKLNPKYSVDGVHLNGAGYKLWTEILKPYVNE